MKLAGFGCSCMFGFSGDAGSAPTKQNSVGYQLSTLMKRDWLNKAINGSGNDLIYEKIIISHSAGEINPKDTFVLIGWSEGFRRKVFYNDKVWEVFRPASTIHNPNEDYWGMHSDSLFSEYFMNTNQMYYDNLKSIIGTYTFLEKFNYNYLMFDALTIMNDGNYTELNDYKISDEFIPQSFIDIKNSIKNYFTNIQYNHFLEDLYQKGKMPFLSDKDHHPNEYGAKEYAKLLYEEIK